MARQRAQFLVAAAVAAAGLSAAPPARAQAAPAPADLYAVARDVLTTVFSGNWSLAGHDLWDTHATFVEPRLTPATVSGLVPLWTFTTVGDVRATPTVEGNDLYVPDNGGYLYRIDARNGAQVWRAALSDLTGITGSNSRSSPAITPRTIIVGDQMSGNLMAVDKATGALVWKTLLDTNPNAIVTASPIVVGNRVYVGVSSSEETMAAKVPGFQPSFRGSIVALDVNTGQVLWSFSTVPQGYTGGAVWGSSASIDIARGTIYVGTGDNYTLPPAVASCVQGAGTMQAQAACLSPDDHIDSILALDLFTGQLKWARSFNAPDTWTVSCITPNPATPCPQPTGHDYDFGSGPNVFTTTINGQLQEVVGAGEKSGVYWALNPDTGATIWATQVGPGGVVGGIQWGSATDTQRIYVPVTNSDNVATTLQPSRQTVNAGFWSALNPATGAILWQVPATGTNPAIPSLGANAFSFVAVANGVMYAGSTSGDMVALNGADGSTLWRFQSGGSVVGGPAIVGGRLYWGSGYTIGRGLKVTENNKLYAFGLPGAQ